MKRMSREKMLEVANGDYSEDYYVEMFDSFDVFVKDLKEFDIDVDELLKMKEQLLNGVRRLDHVMFDKMTDDELEYKLEDLAYERDNNNTTS